MSTRAVLKKDVQDSIRARTLWGLIVVFFLLISGLTYLAVDQSSGDVSVETIVSGLSFSFGILFFVPIAGLLVSIKSVVRERNSGSIKLLLTLPHSRRDVILGKFLGRAGVISAATILGFLPSVILVLVQADGLPVGESLALVASAVLVGVMFVAIGVGFSALVNTETQATMGGVVLFFLMYLWPFILQFGVSRLLNRDIPAFVGRFSFLSLFADIIASLSPSGGGLTDASSAANLAGNGDPSLFMQNWFVFVILALWILVPLVVGYLRFENTDL